MKSKFVYLHEENHDTSNSVAAERQETYATLILNTYYITYFFKSRDDNNFTTNGLIIPSYDHYKSTDDYHILVQALGTTLLNERILL